MKKNMIAVLLILNVCSTHTFPSSISGIGGLYSKITNHAIYRTCRKIGYIATICGACYWIARYFNDYRNTRRKATFVYTKIDNDHFGTLAINTDGLTTIQGRDSEYVRIRTERLNADARHHSLFKQDIPAQAQTGNNYSLWQKFWQWLLRPAHRTVARHIVSVPHNTNITVHTKNAHKIAHPDEPPISIDAINGIIDAQTRTGDIRITNSRGNVRVENPDFQTLPTE